MHERHHLLTYLKKEKVLTIAFALAILSSFFVHPDKQYIEYIDLRVLAILFCLMLLVKGFQEIGLFDLLIQRTFGRIRSSRHMFQMLVLVCFFTSMIITNDVALITFVPLAIATLRLCRRQSEMIPVIVLQTMAANLGSMLTPIGNPQNLYLFTVSGISLPMFLATMTPVALLSLILLMLLTLLLPNEPVQLEMTHETIPMERGRLAVYSVLFLFDLMVVFRLVHWVPALVVTVVGVVLIREQELLRRVDYSLLLTFVGFFIFVGNIGRIEQIRTLVEQLLVGKEVLISALFSQLLSNVPTALLLSGFTDNYQALLVGVNVGGLGTLIASMASLISYKLYAAQPGADKTKYMLWFSVANGVGLVLLLGFSMIVYG